MSRRVSIVVFIGFLAACANPLNQRTAENYFAAGERALAAGNLPLAKQNYSRALVNAEIGRLGPAAEAQAASKLAQVLGNLCEYDDAEKMFLRALSAQEAAFGATSARTLVTRVELAQFNFDIGRHEKAVIFYESAFANGGSLLESHDPTSYATLIDDYAISLAQTGKPQRAAEATAKATALRANAKSPSAGVVTSSYVPYPKSCPKS
jgi:tetratricopeptide (TPR) repeat protein